MRIRAAFSVIAVLLLAAASDGCAATSPTAPMEPNVPLSPARQLAGVWQTPNSVQFTYQSDFCGSREDVARARWNVTWNIRAVDGYTNLVEIEMRISAGTPALIGRCRTGWILPVSPTFIQAVVSSSRLTRSSTDTTPGLSLTGSLTTDNLAMNWRRWQCIIYCFGEYTAGETLILTKRS